MTMQAGAELPTRIRAVLSDACGLAAKLHGVVAIGLAGSWARGAGRPESDVDIVVVLENPAVALGTTAWFSSFGEHVTLVRSSDFGAIQERRLRLRDGLQVEVGIGGPDWVSTDPVDPGTERVVRDGFISLYDPRSVLAQLHEAVVASQ